MRTETLTFETKLARAAAHMNVSKDKALDLAGPDLWRIEELAKVLCPIYREDALLNIVEGMVCGTSIEDYIADDMRDEARAEAQDLEGTIGSKLVDDNWEFHTVGDGKIVRNNSWFLDNQVLRPAGVDGPPHFIVETDLPAPDATFTFAEACKYDAAGKTGIYATPFDWAAMMFAEAINKQAQEVRGFAHSECQAFAQAA